MLRDQPAVPRRVVGDEIDDQAHPFPLGRRQEPLEVPQRSELRVDPVVVTHCVRAAERAFPVQLADRVHRQ